jgi:FSR family fosmidomycin resistance protein-like MFS transporter
MLNRAQFRTRATYVDGKRLGLLTLSHAVNDFYAGAIPAVLPFLVTERHYSYAAISGVTLASTVLSSAVQPLFGVLTDRHNLTWLIGVGIVMSAIGVAIMGVSDSYVLTCVGVAISGLGFSAYHPDGSRAARAAAGTSAQGMSVFATGGNVGIALAPIAVGFLLARYGLGATPVLAVPVLLVAVMAAGAYLLSRANRSVQSFRPPTESRRAVSEREEAPQGNDWRGFRLLVYVIVIRSIGLRGIMTFLALIIISKFHTSAAMGAYALGVFGAAGVVGTLLGGTMADKLGRVRTVRWSYALAPLALLGVIVAPNLVSGLVFTALLGLLTNVPFSVQVTLGQEYLPARLGTASGVTLGLGISIGGAFTPVLGFLADDFGLGSALLASTAALAIAFAVSLLMAEPDRYAAVPQPGVD